MWALIIIGLGALGMVGLDKMTERDERGDKMIPLVIGIFALAAVLIWLASAVH